MADVTSNIQKELLTWNKDKTFAEGTRAELTGSSMESSNQLAELAKLSMFSIGIVFMILLMTLKSFRASIAILISLLPAAIVSLLGLVDYPFKHQYFLWYWNADA